MKKFIIILVAVIATMFTSCSNEQASLITPLNSNEVVENANIEFLSALQGKISMLNDSMALLIKKPEDFSAVFGKLYAQMP